MTTTIKRISKSEIHLVQGLDYLIFGAAECTAEIEEYNETIWWVAFEEGQPVAFTGALIYSHEGRCMQLQRTGVLPAYRGQGLQKKLIRARLAYARRKKVKWVHTYVISWNCPSLNSLVRTGFTFYTPEYAYAGDPEGDGTYLYLWKVLKYS